MSNHDPIPADFPVQPLKSGQEAKDKVTCGHCGLSWDDAIPTSWTPAPSARCPFEYFHLYPEDTKQRSVTNATEKTMSKPLSELFQGRMTGEEKFLKGYILAALDLMEDEEDDPDAEEKNTRNVTVDDIAPSTLKAIKADCDKFFNENKDDVTDDDKILRRSDSVEESAGHDFFLTRHGHGAGFWDGDWEKDTGERLTEASKQFRESDWYVGDDGKVYIMGTEN